MRLCPSVDGTASPLITHRIGVDVCLARQGTFFHKCHRCIYRGQPANWEPEAAPMAMINVHAAEEPSGEEVRKVEVGAEVGRNGAVRLPKSTKAPRPAKVASASAKKASTKNAAAERVAEAGG